MKAHMHHGLGASAIAAILAKTDGRTHWSDRAVSAVMAKLRDDTSWRGERDAGSGAPRKTTKAQDKAVERHVYAKRGRKKVTVSEIKQTFPHLRSFSNTLVEERLAESELEYLRRRKKSKVGTIYLQDRVDYCHSVKRKHERTLALWAYTDGTVYYLDRTDMEHEQTAQAALGAFVWRRSDREDAIYQDCLGPSNYSKAQGTPVRVWGMLACGVLHVHILEEGEVMNQDVYCELIEEHFERWVGNCRYLVCDFERCLRTEASKAELTRAGLELVEGYPRCSQDFNAIENCWNILKERLAETLPRRMERRDQFISRFHQAVAWANRNRAAEMMYFATNQKERADDCLATDPPGGRTKW